MDLEGQNHQRTKHRCQHNGCLVLAVHIHVLWHLQIHGSSRHGHQVARSSIQPTMTLSWVHQQSYSQRVGRDCATATAAFIKQQRLLSLPVQKHRTVICGPQTAIVNMVQGLKHASCRSVTVTNKDGKPQALSSSYHVSNTHVSSILFGDTMVPKIE